MNTAPTHCILAEAWETELLVADSTRSIGPRMSKSRMNRKISFRNLFRSVFLPNGSLDHRDYEEAKNSRWDSSTLQEP